MVIAEGEVGSDFTGKCMKKVRYEVIFEDLEMVAEKFPRKNQTEDFQ